MRIESMSGSKRTAEKKQCREAALLAQGFRCKYCFDLLGNSRVTGDHVVPASTGGLYSRENIVAACLYCNNVRGTMPFSDFVWMISRDVPPVQDPKLLRIWIARWFNTRTRLALLRIADSVGMATAPDT